MDYKQIGKIERFTQDRVLNLFRNKLGYTYLGNWEEEARFVPIEEKLLLTHLTHTAGYSKTLAKKAVDKLMKAATNLSDGLYAANKEVYKLLRYGIAVREELGKVKETVWVIDWKNATNNSFGIAEEVTVVGRNTKRPDIVIYINGIAIGVLELKRSKVGLSEGIRQNLDNQKPTFIEKFFTTMQLVLAGNDTQGLRYGTIETSEKYYLQWKEEAKEEFDYTLDKHLSLLCEKHRLLEIVHDFVVYDKGIKKLCRPNQFFGVKAAENHVLNRKGGIIWHTQGSGKSLTMVWLTKWIRENVNDSRVLIITDREELDDQIEKLFFGIDEKIYRTKSGRDLIQVLNQKTEMLVCSLVHKFGRNSEEGDFDGFIKEILDNLGSILRQRETYMFLWMNVTVHSPESFTRQ